MGKYRLNGLSMMTFHRDLVITPEKVVEEFARRNPKRCSLISHVLRYFYLSKNEYSGVSQNGQTSLHGLNLPSM